MACEAEDIAGKSEVTLGKSLADGLSEHNCKFIQLKNFTLSLYLSL